MSIQKKSLKVIEWAFHSVPAVHQLWKRGRQQLGVPSFARLRKPLSDCHIGMVTTGGVHHVESEPFLTPKASRHGDGSFRQLDLSRPREDFVISNAYFDTRDAEADLNLVLPVWRMGELASDGVLAGVHPLGFGLMGHVAHEHMSQLAERTAPEIARRVREAELDAVLLVPA